MKARRTLSILVLTFGVAALCDAQRFSKPELAGDLRNDPAREQEFMDWGLGMFVHWSFDSQLGSVISHSMDYASRKYLDRYVNELPRTFNPTEYDPDKWMEIAKLAQRLYNNRRWPNAVVLRLENVEFNKLVAQ